MQYTPTDKLSGHPVSTVNRAGLVILAILFFPLTMLLLVFWTDAIGFWNQFLAGALVVLLLGVCSMAVNAAMTGRIRLSWFLAPIILAAATWGALSVF